MEDEKNVKWSHCYGWPTQVEDRKNMKCGLIIMGDLPRWKIEKIWSGLIVMGDLPKWKECEKRSHYDGWPTQMERMWSVVLL
jgi:hypothetical protein